MAPKNQAIVVTSPGQASIEEVPIPKLRDDYIIVKVKAISVQPTDWKHIDRFGEPGVRIGCDYAGVVEKVGSKVTKPFKQGQRVCGFVHGGNAVCHEDGAFGNYITAMSDEGGLYDALRTVAISDVKAINPKVQLRQTLGYKITGEYFQMGAAQHQPEPELFEFTKKFLDAAREALSDGGVKMHNFSVNEGGSGLQGALVGIDEVRNLRVSGKKLVYTLEDSE